MRTRGIHSPFAGRRTQRRQGGLTLLEIYETDPTEETDPNKWVTDIAFLLRS